MALASKLSVAGITGNGHWRVPCLLLFLRGLLSQENPQELLLPPPLQLPWILAGVLLPEDFRGGNLTPRLGKSPGDSQERSLLDNCNLTGD